MANQRVPIRVREEPKAPNAAPAVSAEVTALQATVADQSKTLGLLLQFLPQLAGGGAHPSRKEVLEEMKMILELRPAAPAGSASDALDFLKQGIALGKLVGGKDDGESGGIMAMLGEVAKHYLPAIAGALQPGAAAPPAAPGAAPALPAPPGSAPAQDLLDWRPMLGMLVAMAQADAEEETYANVLLDVAGPDLAGEFLRQEDWLEQLAAFNPAVRNFVPWFTKLREIALELLASEAEPEPGAELTPAGVAANNDAGAGSTAGGEGVPPQQQQVVGRRSGGVVGANT